MLEHEQLDSLVGAWWDGHEIRRFGCWGCRVVCSKFQLTASLIIELQQLNLNLYFNNQKINLRVQL